MVLACVLDKVLDDAGGDNCGGESSAACGGDDDGDGGKVKVEGTLAGPV